MDKKWSQFYDLKRKCERAKRTTQLSLIEEVQPVQVEPKEPRVISEADAKRELRRIRHLEGLDRPKTKHVCHFYPPAMRCICGKRQETS